MSEKRTVSESITYKAQPHKPFRVIKTQYGPIEIPNMFPTNKFEGFKICCGQCFHLGITDAILATRNVECCGMCKPCYKMCCPSELKRMEHYCSNCGNILAVAHLPELPGCPSLVEHWSRTIPHVEKFRAQLRD